MSPDNMQKTHGSAIIVGANSHLSRELARQLSSQNIKLALLASSNPELESFASSIDATIYPVDLFDIEQAQTQLQQAWADLEGCQLILINTGFHQYDPELHWQPEQDTISINVMGFAAMANAAFNLFKAQGYGQIAAINSIAGLRGGASVSYHASKAFAQNYLEGLSMHAQRLKLGITISDIQLGLLDKAAQQGRKMWLAPLPAIAKQILKALAKGKRRCYVPKRWIIIAWLTRLLPEYIYNTRRWKKKDAKNK